MNKTLETYVGGQLVFLPSFIQSNGFPILQALPGDITENNLFPRLFIIKTKYEKRSLHDKTITSTELRVRSTELSTER